MKIKYNINGGIRAWITQIQNFPINLKEYLKRTLTSTNSLSDKDKESDIIEKIKSITMEELRIEIYLKEEESNDTPATTDMTRTRHEVTRTT